MGILRMGYAHSRVTDLNEAKQHYANTLGLYETLDRDGKVYYKGWDEWDHHSLVLEEGGVGVVKYGFKVEKPEDIDEIEQKGKAFGLTMEPGAAETVERHVRLLLGGLAPWDSGRRYLNFAESLVDVRSIYPEQTFERLLDVKARYDPTDMFRANHRVTRTGTALASA